MRVLYEAYKHDPHNPMAGSGADHHFFKAIEAGGHEVQVLGPLDPDHRTLRVERWIRKKYLRHTGKKYSKFSWSSVRKTSALLNQEVRSSKPDLVFTIFPASLVYYNASVPTVYRVDTTMSGVQGYQHSYGPFAMRMMKWMETRALQRATQIITHSTWNKEALVQEYGIAAHKIHVFPNPAALPSDVVPASGSTFVRDMQDPIRLLLVGRDYHRKGIDIVLRIAELLDQKGLPAEVTICGTEKQDHPSVRFVGVFDKRDPEQLAQYVGLYQQADVLVHPARFDASPIVTSEAAAFGLPTLTNASGGLATSVKDGVSGVVLPKGSPAEAYVAAINELRDAPERYRNLRASTRARYEQELNWEVAAQSVQAVLEQALQTVHR